MTTHKNTPDFRPIRVYVICNTPDPETGEQWETEITSADRKTLDGRRNYAAQLAADLSARDGVEYVVVEARE